MSKMTMEQAQELRNTALWQNVVNELDYRIEACLGNLKTCMEQDLPELQMKIRLLESLKNLPEDVIDREETVSGILGSYRETDSSTKGGHNA